MNAKLTLPFIKSLKARDKVYEVSDSEVPGFLVRVQTSGNISYYVSYRSRGTRKKNRIRLGPTSVMSPTEARDKARAILGDEVGLPAGQVSQQLLAVKWLRYRISVGDLGP
jgi:hypothetical protein